MEPIRYSPRHATVLRRRLQALMLASLGLATLAVVATTFLPGTAHSMPLASQQSPAGWNGAHLRQGDSFAAPGLLSPCCFFGGAQ